MTDLIFLLWGLIPVALGIGLIYKPRQVLKAQASFRKRMERLEKRFFKAHQATGLFFILIGLVMILSWFHPVWIYNAIVMARILSGDIFVQPVDTIVVEMPPTLWI